MDISCTRPSGPRRAQRSWRATRSAAAGQWLPSAGGGVRRAGARGAASWSSSRAGRLAPHDNARAGPRRDHMKFMLLHYADETTAMDAEQRREDQALLASWLEDTIARGVNLQGSY